MRIMAVDNRKKLYKINGNQMDNDFDILSKRQYYCENGRNVGLFSKPMAKLGEGILAIVRKMDRFVHSRQAFNFGSFGTFVILRVTLRIS